MHDPTMTGTGMWTRLRPLRLLLAALTIAALPAFTVLTTAEAATATLNGETFVGTMQGIEQYNNCANNGIVAGTHYIHYGFTGAATGPIVGTFREDGDVTIVNGVVTSWTAEFTIYSSDIFSPVLAKGTKSLAPGGTGTGMAVCQGSPYSQASATSNSLIYKVSSPFTETGPSQASFNFVSIETFLNRSFTGSFTEHFGPAGPAPGCDTNGDSQGNDQCNQ